MCLLWISGQTVTFPLYKINCLVFITEVDIVYCTVQSESLYETDMFYL